MRKLLSILLLLLPVLTAECKKTGSSVSEHSYSVSPITATPSLDAFNQVDYQLSGNNIHAYSTVTVCFRRLSKSGYEISYSEITDTRENPNTYQVYHTLKKLNSDESGVKVKWLELTDKDTGATTRYINYK